MPGESEQAEGALAEFNSLRELFKLRTVHMPLVCRVTSTNDMFSKSFHLDSERSVQFFRSAKSSASTSALFPGIDPRCRNHRRCQMTSSVKEQLAVVYSQLWRATSVDGVGRGPALA